MNGNECIVEAYVQYVTRRVSAIRRARDLIADYAGKINPPARLREKFEELISLVKVGLFPNGAPTLSTSLRVGKLVAELHEKCKRA